MSRTTRFRPLGLEHGVRTEFPSAYLRKLPTKATPRLERDQKGTTALLLIQVLTAKLQVTLINPPKGIPGLALAFLRRHWLFLTAVF